VGNRSTSTDLRARPTRRRHPAAKLGLDPALLADFPHGYRHLAYVQERIGYAVMKDVSGLTAPAAEKLYSEGRALLEGSAAPRIPLADTANKSS